MSNHEELSKRQQSILDFIRTEINSKGYPPSVREIGKAVGLSSSSTVHSHLASLEKTGYIRRDPTKPRAIELLGNDNFISNKELASIPLVGQITAGQPILASENIEDTFPLPLNLLNHGGESIFMLKVRGDSMIEAGIHDGDYILVRQQSIANDGDIVVALLGEEATVKTFYKEKHAIRLQPENKSLTPIISRDVKIIGKVVGLFRTIY